METDKKVAGVDKEKRILPVSRESPAHIKESKKGGGEGRCDKNVECRRRGGQHVMCDSWDCTLVFRGVRVLDPETHSRREGRGGVEYCHAGAA